MNGLLVIVNLKLSNILLFLYVKSVLISVSPLLNMIAAERYEER